MKTYVESIVPGFAAEKSGRFLVLFLPPLLYSTLELALSCKLTSLHQAPHTLTSHTRADTHTHTHTHTHTNLNELETQGNLFPPETQACLHILKKIEK